MEGWIRFTKSERNYEWSAVYEHKNKPGVRYLYAADVYYHLGCWLGVTVKYMPTGLGAIVTAITSILVLCKCNRQRR